MNGRRDGDPYGRAVREGTPACCLTCGDYHPALWVLCEKECAAFGTVDGVKDGRCGAWEPREK